MQEKTCDICGVKFRLAEWLLHHNYHDPDCHNFAILEYKTPCECDNVAHAYCCPECQYLDNLEEVNHAEPHKENEDD